MIATRLQQGSPSINRATLMGKVMDTPQIRQDAQGELAIVLLRVQESMVYNDSMLQGFSGRQPCSSHPDRHHALPLLVRGLAAQWCAEKLRTGALVMAEARITPLGVTETGACLTMLEADHLQLVSNAPFLLAAQRSIPPVCATFRNAAFMATAHSLRTN
ncbi:hypothetical protein N1030_17350 [Desulfovibrio mangrovi]|uniref:hypothetical protein n=1 Tax=Desulfovibrio mangrovi TaxID=2976983 RepID=UPI0022474BD5|nr:hypothetical protein [Desulfovibrio mangrovi]UZP67340.1 hypothetical protein N1030_17350 [Desulfovibrio mangrovi]